MEPTVRVFTDGSLCTDLGGSSLSGLLKLNLSCVFPLVQLSDELDITPDSVQLAMVNHRASTKNRNYQTWRQNSVFPREYPIFADWIDLRMRGVKCPTD